MPNLFQKIGHNIDSMKNLESFNAQNLSNIAWAYARANVKQPVVFQKVAGYIANLVDSKSYNPQDLSNTAWAYSVVNIDAPSLFGVSFIEALANRKNELTELDYRQLYQWHLWQTQELFKTGLPEFVQQKCYQVFSSTETTSSALQREVVTELNSMGLNPVAEYVTNSGYSIDALIKINHKNVGIEVDGPTHFIGRRPTGSTVLKHRQVVAIDKIPLVSVPYWEWNKLKNDRNLKQQYLQQLLDTVK